MFDEAWMMKRYKEVGEALHNAIREIQSG